MGIRAMSLSTARLRVAVAVTCLAAAFSVSLALTPQKVEAACTVDGCWEYYCDVIGADRWCRGRERHHYVANDVTSGPFRKCAVLEYASNYLNATATRCTYDRVASVWYGNNCCAVLIPAAFNGDNSAHNFTNYGWF